MTTNAELMEYLVAGVEKLLATVEDEMDRGMLIACLNVLNEAFEMNNATQVIFDEQVECVNIAVAGARRRMESRSSS